MLTRWIWCVYIIFFLGKKWWSIIKTNFG
jgi:hypothetical protein